MNRALRYAVSIMVALLIVGAFLGGILLVREHRQLENLRPLLLFAFAPTALLVWLFFLIWPKLPGAGADGSAVVRPRLEGDVGEESDCSYVLIGRWTPREAEEILCKLAHSQVRFEIDVTKRRSSTSRRSPLSPIEIYVHRDDLGRGKSIVSANK